MRSGILALRLLSALLAGLAGLGPALADATVLTVDGKVASGEPVDFSILDLEALGTERVETSTPWHDEPVVFEGVPLQRLMEHVGAEGDIAYVVALNTYSSEVPLSDFGKHGVILASRMNGQAMPVSEKGPLFIVYPFDSSEALQTELYHSRSVWQVRHITIE